MTRHELKFTLYYSQTFEEMHARFWGRTDRLLTFLQIVLGSAVFADVGNNMLFGGLLVALSSASFVLQPAMAAIRHTKRDAMYTALILRESQLSDEQLQIELAKAAEDKPTTLGLLANPAHMRACIEIGCPPTTTLTFWEKMAALIAGDIPRV